MPRTAGCQLKARDAAGDRPAREKADISVTRHKPTRGKKKRAYAASYNRSEQPLREDVQSCAVIQRKTKRPLKSRDLPGTDLQKCPPGSTHLLITDRTDTSTQLSVKAESNTNTRVPKFRGRAGNSELLLLHKHV